MRFIGCPTSSEKISGKSYVSPQLNMQYLQETLLPHRSYINWSLHFILLDYSHTSRLIPFCIFSRSCSFHKAWYYSRNLKAFHMWLLADHHPVSVKLALLHIYREALLCSHLQLRQLSTGTHYLPLLSTPKTPRTASAPPYNQLILILFRIDTHKCH